MPRSQKPEVRLSPKIEEQSADRKVRQPHEKLEESADRKVRQPDEKPEQSAYRNVRQPVWKEKVAKPRDSKVSVREPENCPEESEVNVT